MNDTTKVRANRRHLVHLAVPVTKTSDLRQTATQDRTAARLDLVGGFYFARRDPIKILRGHVESFFGKIARRTDRFPRWVVERFPGILLAKDKIGKQHAGNGPVS